MLVKDVEMVSGRTLPLNSSWLPQHCALHREAPVSHGFPIPWILRMKPACWLARFVLRLPGESGGHSLSQMHETAMVAVLYLGPRSSPLVIHLKV